MKYSILTFLLTLAASALAQDFAYTTFDPPGSTGTAVTGMNNAGQIVGSYSDAKGTHNFLRSADGKTFTTIDLPGATPGTTTIGAINNTGQVAGTYQDASTGFTRCYVGSVDGSTFTPFDLGDEFGPGGGPKGLNDSGVVSGAVVEASASAAWGFMRTPDGTITTIAISAAGTRVRGIDNNGDIVGWYFAGGSEDGLIHGFLRNPAGVITTFDLPGTDNFTEINGINNQAQITGSWSASYSGFVAIADRSYPILAIPGAQATFPAAVNDNGAIAGAYSDGTTGHGFVAVPISGSTQPVIRTFPLGVITALGFGGASTVAPGTWIEIYGENLSSVTRAWNASDFINGAAPTLLSGVTVSVGGAPAIVSYVSPGQVNAFMPSTTAAGPVPVTVSNGPQTSAPFTVTVEMVQPSLWVLPQTDDQTSRYLAAVFPDFVTYVLPPGYTTEVATGRAHPGDTIILFGMGLGSGVPSVAFNGTPAQVTYGGPMPGAIGLYQINVVVPQIAMPAGQTYNDSVDVTVQANGVITPSGPPPMFYWLPVAQQ